MTRPAVSECSLSPRSIPCPCRSALAAMLELSSVLYTNGASYDTICVVLATLAAVNYLLFDGAHGATATGALTFAGRTACCQAVLRARARLCRCHPFCFQNEPYCDQPLPTCRHQARAGAGAAVRNWGARH